MTSIASQHRAVDTGASAEETGDGTELRTDEQWERFLGVDRSADTPNAAPPPTDSRTVSPAATVRRGWVVARTILLLCSDLLAANAAGAIARGARVGYESLPNTVPSPDSSLTLTYAQLSTLVALAWIVALGFVGAHHKRRFDSLLGQAAALLRGAVGLLALIGVASLFTRVQLSRSFVAVALVALPVLTFLGRIAIFAMFQMLMRTGILAERVLLIGPARQTAEVRRHLDRTSHGRVVVIAEHHTADAGAPAAPSDPGSAHEPILDLVRRRGLTSVIVCGQTALPPGTVRRLSTLLCGSGVSLIVAPGTSEALGPAFQIHPIGDLVLLRVRDGEPRFVERVAKSVFDRVGALVALFIGAPILAAVAIAVRLEGRGVFFRQTRVGRRGRTFMIYKFRTMTPDAEERLHREGLYERYVAAGYKLPADEDPRITRTGRFLRRTSLDELPQLINVLRGQMSLVGPRPVVAKELASYGELTPVYTGVKPGLTGYWQINGRSDVGFPERAELDGYYYDHRSLRFDLRILARTVVAVVLRRGAH